MTSKSGNNKSALFVIIGVLQAVLLLAASALLAWARADIVTNRESAETLKHEVNENRVCIEVLRTELAHLNKTAAEMRDELKTQSGLLKTLNEDDR